MTLEVKLGEGCIYLYENGAINKSDYVLNGVLKNQWDAMNSESTADVSYINLGAPKDLLQAFYHKCKTSSNSKVKGLLSAVGYDSIVNVTKLIESQEISNGLTEGKM